eukprot:7751579-Alexandrium_andersonii.AAC.1
MFPALFRLVERRPGFLASVLSHFKRVRGGKGGLEAVGIAGAPFGPALGRGRCTRARPCRQGSCVPHQPGRSAP